MWVFSLYSYVSIIILLFKFFLKKCSTGMLQTLNSSSVAMKLYSNSVILGEKTKQNAISICIMGKLESRIEM